MFRRQIPGRYQTPAVLAAALLLIAATPSMGKTVYVNGAIGDDLWTGLCEEWDGETCGPKASIQAGIDVAADGDEVADGIYTGKGNRDIRLHGLVITLKSANGPANCIIDGLWEDYPIFNIIDEEGHNTIIDGFTVMKCAAC